MTDRELAIYDLDRTITRAGTYTPFLLFWAARRAPWRLLLAPAALACMAAYAAKRISRKRLKELMHLLLMGPRTSKEDLEPAVEAFARRIVDKGVYPEAKAAIAADRAKGRRVVLATAAYGFYAEAIARMLGISDVVATRARRDASGALLAKVEGENCYGTAKLAMIEDFLKEAGIDRARTRIRFYSDHASDLPVFAWADEPVAVNAASGLKMIAVQKGWPLLDWRRP